jgi:energy-coupling factor transporter ATP-binding protein EcfA2
MTTQNKNTKNTNVNILDENINKHFKPPIYFNPYHITLSKDIITDLEINKTIDPSNRPMIQWLYNDTTDLGKVVGKETSKYYTTDIEFINDTQCYLKSIVPCEPNEKCDVKKVYECWKSITTHKDFKDRYNYVEWDMLLFLNENELFLQFMSMYNLASPVLALLVPLVILVVPFFVLKMKNIDVTFEEYMIIFRSIAKTHVLSRVFTGFSDASLQQKVYMLVSLGLYFLSLYQNVQVCRKFYNNMKSIHQDMFSISSFIKMMSERIGNFEENTQSLPTYKNFQVILETHKSIMKTIMGHIDRIPPFSISIKKLCNLGTVLKGFYDLHTKMQYNETMCFLFGFCGYLDNIEGIKRNLDNKKMCFGTLQKKSKKKKKNDSSMKIENMYYPALMNGDPIKNSFKTKKDFVITGPNASGKTTILKSMLLNIIFTQQYGCGFYDNFTFVPYKHLHCYLNVPDTSGRDSLFQSESRKCKEILDIIQQSKKTSKTDRHFCMFDELYSGTNPEEAIKCGHAYLSHLNDIKQVDFVLTTHYKELCNKLESLGGVEMYRMKVNVNKDVYDYTYSMEKGINQVDGGIEILRQMNYPTDIINKLHMSKKTKKITKEIKE